MDQQRRGREFAAAAGCGSGSSWSWSQTSWSAGSPRRSLSPPAGGAGRGGSRAAGTLPGPVRRCRAVGGVPAAGSQVGSPAGGRELLEKGGRIFHLRFFGNDKKSEHARTKVLRWKLFFQYVIFIANVFQSTVHSKKLNNIGKLFCRDDTWSLVMSDQTRNQL